MGTATRLYEDLWRFLERSDWQSLMALFTDDVEIVFQDARFSGAIALRGYLQTVMQALPDLTHEITEIIEGDAGLSLAGIVVARGSHSGPVKMFGRQFDLSGRTSVFQAVDLLWVRDSRISKWWAMYDPIERMQSLGLKVSATDSRGS